MNNDPAQPATAIINYREAIVAESAAVQAVRALQRWTHASATLTESPTGAWLKYADVIAALGAAE